MNTVFALPCHKYEFLEGMKDAVFPNDINLFGVYEFMMQLKGGEKCAKLPVQAFEASEIKSIGG